MNIKIKTADNFILDATFNEIKGSTKAIIFAHGMTVSRDEEDIFVKAESKLNELGFSTSRFDFRGHGKSQGDSTNDFTISGELQDLEAVVKFMEEKGIIWLGVAAASFGGSISALFVEKYPQKIKKLFLANPVLNYGVFLHPVTPWALSNFANASEKFKENGFINIDGRFKIGKRLFDEMKIFNPCESLKSFKEPLFAVHGDKDTKIPLEHSVECIGRLESRQKSFEIIKGSDHGFDEEPYETEVVEMITNFFKS